MTQTTAEVEDESIRLEIVAAGNGWWVNTGPDPSDIATYVFIDATRHPRLLELPDGVRGGALTASATWEQASPVLKIVIHGEWSALLELDAERPELEAVRRARLLFVCPTTPDLGISPYLARDRSFPVRPERQKAPDSGLGEI